MDWLGHESHGFPHQTVLQDKKKNHSRGKKINNLVFYPNFVILKN